MNDSKNRVRILLAAYQGATFLPAQLDSLLAQTHPNLEIIVSDDGSTDGSAEILSEYAAAHPEKILYYRSGCRFGSSQAHFLHLLRQFRDAPYLMFCDQDDVWHSSKVSRSLSALKENCPDPAVPALLHTDLRVVDRNLQVLNPSFLRFSGLDGNALSLPQLLTQNVVTGCTILMNRALSDLFCSAPELGDVLMHDWYLSLVAAACGKIFFLDEATIDYRQHGGNVVGAKNVRNPSYVFRKLLHADLKKSFSDTTAQAASLLAAFSFSMSKANQEVLCQYSRLPTYSKLQRLQLYNRFGFWKQGLPRRVGQILFW